MNWSENKIGFPGFYSGAKRQFFRMRNRIPFIKSLIDKEVEKAGKSIHDNIEQLYRGRDKKAKFITVLPKTPMKTDAILAQVESYLKLGKN